MTPRERECLDAIDRLTVNGVAPSFDDLMAELSLSSKSGVARLLDQLQGEGWIWRSKHKARSIEILRHPDLKAHLVTLIEQNGLQAVSEALESARQAVINV